MVGFDKTFAFVLFEQHIQPSLVSPTGDNNQNVIVWMEHREVEQATQINATYSQVLDCVGDTISPEMQKPKLLWLHVHSLDTFASTGQFLILLIF